MVKLLVKLAIAALLANAVYRVGSEYLTYVRFRDSIREAAMFKARDNGDLKERIMALSAQFDIPLDEDAVAIEREDRHVSIQGRYEKPIEIAPTWLYPWSFSWSLDVITSPFLPAPLPPK